MAMSRVAHESGDRIRPVIAKAAGETGDKGATRG